MRFERADSPGCATLLCPRFFQSTGCVYVTDAINSPRFDVVVDVALVLAGVALIVEQMNALGGREMDEDGRPDSLWNVIELVFCVFFTLEMLLKVGALGWRAYSRSLKNLFDALVTVTTVAVVVIVYVPNFFNDASAIRYVMMLRMLRLARLLGKIPTVAFIARTFLSMLPSLSKLLKVLFCIMYLFAALGVAAFGGVINTDPTNPRNTSLAESDFGQADYYANNFNDLASGFVTCFELLLLNNWFVICHGFVVAVNSAWVSLLKLTSHLPPTCCSTLPAHPTPLLCAQARLFFVAFWAICVLICLNVVVAFALDAFQENADSNQSANAADATPNDTDLAPIVATDSPRAERAMLQPAGLSPGSFRRANSGSVYFNASMVTGTRTGLDNEEWRASVPESIPAHRRRSILHKLTNAVPSPSSSLSANEHAIAEESEP